MGYFSLDNIKDGRLYQIIYNNNKYYLIKYDNLIYEIDGYNIEIGESYKISIKENLNFEIDKIKYIKYRQIINFKIIKDKIKFFKLDKNQKTLYQYI